MTRWPVALSGKGCCDRASLTGVHFGVGQPWADGALGQQSLQVRKTPSSAGRDGESVCGSSPFEKLKHLFYRDSCGFFSIRDELLGDKPGVIWFSTLPPGIVCHLLGQNSP